MASPDELTLDNRLKSHSSYSVLKYAKFKYSHMSLLQDYESITS